MSLKKKIKITSVRVYLNNLAYISPRRAGDWAIKLFSLPQKGRLTEDDKAYLQSATESVFYFQDVKIQTYKWQGGEKTVLLVHGWESNSARWQWLIPYLKAENYTIIALDAPAHGASGSPYFNAFLYAEMIAKVIKETQPSAVIGHSVGAYASIVAASKTPENAIEKLIIMAAPCNLRHIFDKFFRILKLNTRVQKSYYKTFYRILGKTVDEVTALHFIPKIKAKGLLIYDKKDDIVALDESFKIQAHWADSDIFVTDNLGHSLQNDIIYNKITAFLK